MNRVEFMNELEKLLKSIPEEERKDALEYYENYFDEAGPEREAEVIRELVSPQHVAQTILDSMESFAGSGDTRQNTKECGEKGGNYDYDRSTVPPTNNKYGSLEILLMVLIAIMAAPFVFSLAGVVLGVIAAAFGMVIGFSIAGVSVIAAAVAAFVSGVPGIGFVLLGVAFLLLCFVCLLIPLDMWLCKSAFPAIFYWCKKWCKKIFGKGGETA